MPMNPKGKFFDPPKILVSGFALIILIGALLLMLPVATVDGKGLPFLDALFTATSATCVTGLFCPRFTRRSLRERRARIRLTSRI